MARILVVGCGAIGGLVAARLTEHHAAEHEVEALTTNVSIADAITRDGLRVVGVEGESVAPVRAVRSPSGTYDFVLLATQPPQVEAAARDVVGHLAHDGAMVCFQNGLVEERIAPIAGSERVLGGVIAWGASMQAPGVVERTSHGGFALGRFAGEDDTRLRELATLLEVIGPVDVEPDLAGARWSKLAINCAISTLGTIGGDRLGALMKHRVVRRLALELMTETVEVARAEGVKLRKVSGTLDLDWLALRPEERRGGSASLVAKHSLLLAVGARYRKLRSSMLYAIERGREPAVDFLNGEVVTRGEKHGVPTPVSAEAQRTVHAIARGEHAPSMETLREFAARVL